MRRAAQVQPPRLSDHQRVILRVACASGGLTRKRRVDAAWNARLDGMLFSTGHATVQRLIDCGLLRLASGGYRAVPTTLGRSHMAPAQAAASAAPPTRSFE